MESYKSKKGSPEKKILCELNLTGPMEVEYRCKYGISGNQVQEGQLEMIKVSFGVIVGRVVCWDWEQQG